MSKATDVVISGCSAGGLATFLHCDHWAAAIDKATTAETGAGAKVACMPDSGFFLDEERSPKYHSNMQNVCKSTARAYRSVLSLSETGLTDRR